MKKLLLFSVFIPLAIACSSTSTENTAENSNPEVSEKINETAKKADKIYEKATKLEEQADSLLNSL